MQANSHVYPAHLEPEFPIYYVVSYLHTGVNKRQDKIRSTSYYPYILTKKTKIFDSSFLVLIRSYTGAYLANITFLFIVYIFFYFFNSAMRMRVAELTPTSPPRKVYSPSPNR